MRVQTLFALEACLILGALTGCHHDSGVILIPDSPGAPSLMTVERGGTLKFRSESSNDTFTINDPELCKETTLTVTSKNSVTCHVLKTAPPGLHTLTITDNKRSGNPRDIKMYVRPCPSPCSQ